MAIQRLMVGQLCRIASLDPSEDVLPDVIRILDWRQIDDKSVALVMDVDASHPHYPFDGSPSYVVAVDRLRPLLDTSDPASVRRFLDS